MVRCSRIIGSLALIVFAGVTWVVAASEEGDRPKIEFRWLESRLIPGVTEDKGISNSEDGTLSYPHRKAVLTNADVVDVRVNTVHIANKDHFTIQFHLTGAARKKLADGCGEKGEKMLTAMVDGRHRGSPFYLKSRDQDTFVPYAGFFTSKPDVDRIVAAFQFAAPRVTSLTDPDVKFQVPAEHHVTLKRGPITAVIVDNEAVDVTSLPGHKAGYNGVASLRHERMMSDNLFVPAVAGLNFEHIHDGTLAVNVEKFEPRKAPMELRIVDPFTVELYQPPTANWKLESCGRYRLLPDGVIEYTFECIPRAATFQQGYMGLFWASYIAQPEDTAIHFRGREATAYGDGDWLRMVTPTHGVDSTHPPAGPLRNLPMHPEFPLTLVNHRSKYVCTDPWYYGISHGMAFVQMFRSRDQIWLAQSPSGGGKGNPAWDFQWFVPDWKVDEPYGFTMRAALLPTTDQDQILEQTRSHRMALNPKN